MTLLPRAVQSVTKLERECIGVKVHALHADDVSLIPGTAYGLCVLPRVTLEYYRG